jgi:hypothetical protein
MSGDSEIFNAILDALEDVHTLNDIIFIGGWAQFLYRRYFNDPPELSALRTVDIDLLFNQPSKIKFFKPLEPVFTFISDLYERTSVIITSNKDLNSWAELMGDEIMTTPLLDRLMHHAKTYSLSGESYRISSRKKEGKIICHVVGNSTCHFQRGRLDCAMILSEARTEFGLGSPTLSLTSFPVVSKGSDRFLQCPSSLCPKSQ